MGKNNSGLRNADKNKADEFYTRYEDIEKEVYNYRNFFDGKTVLCNCDDPLTSNFTKYFILNFRFLKLKRLICTFYGINGKMAFVFVYDGQDINGDGIINEEDIDAMVKMQAFRHSLMNDMGFDFDNKEKCWEKGIYGSGDFRSQHCIEYLKMADVVVTNPPFSLFRDYVKQLMDYGKKFIIIGNNNALSYKEIFTRIMNNEMWLGTVYNKTMLFQIPDSYEKFSVIENGVKYGKVPAISWFTNIPHKKRNTPIDLYKKYSNKYPKYDNYDAIEVSKVSDIPMDYDGIMGVPITFLGSYCPAQFKILGLAADKRDENEIFIKGKETYLDERHKKFVGMVLDGKATYARVMIKKFS